MYVLIELNELLLVTPYVFEICVVNVVTIFFFIFGFSSLFYSLL